MSSFKLIPNVFVFFSVIMLVSCAENESAQQENQVEVKIVPVQLFEVVSEAEQKRVSFPAKIEPYREVDIAFEVGGKIERMTLLEGQDFKKGDLLASLEKSNFERSVKLSELKVQDAKVELDRITAVDKKGYISKQNVTKAETAYQIAVVEKAISQQNLNNATLTAPFNGVVSKRYVSTNAFVGVGTKVATLQDISKVYIAFDVPEKIVALMNERDVESASVKIMGRNNRMKATYAEHEASPNPVTQTYRVFFQMPYPKTEKLPMGLHSTIELTLSASKTKKTPLVVPLSAIASDDKGGFYVWKLVGDQVKQTAIMTGKMIDHQIEILSGLSAGDKVVSAGVSKMRDEMTVSEFKGGL